MVGGLWKYMGGHPNVGRSRARPWERNVYRDYEEGENDNAVVDQYPGKDGPTICDFASLITICGRFFSPHLWQIGRMDLLES